MKPKTPGTETQAVRILVVDDHPLIRKALCLVLKQLDPGIAVVEAENGPTALGFAAAHDDLKLILLDLSLPGLNGFEVLARMRELRPAVPVVVLSAFDDRDTVIRAVDQGAMGFIPKTSSTELMLHALQVVFSGGVYLPAAILSQGSSLSSTLPQSTAVAPSAKTPFDIGMTVRQAQVLALMLQGKSNKLICRELNLAEGTVKIHVAACLKALNVANRTNAIIEVGRLGLKVDGIRIGSQST